MGLPLLGVVFWRTKHGVFRHQGFGQVLNPLHGMLKRLDGFLKVSDGSKNQVGKGVVKVW